MRRKWRMMIVIVVGLLVAYAKIQVPVLFVYGTHDWSRPGEREANRTITPGSRVTIVSNAGHFLSLDAPEDIIQLILSFRDARHERT